MQDVDPTKRVKALQLLNFARETLIEHDDILIQFTNHEISYSKLCSLQRELRDEVSLYQKRAENLDPNAQLWMLYLK
jgi:hypothetical protein